MQAHNRMRPQDAGPPVVAVRDKHNGARMAFSPCNLSVLAYANGFTLWHYSAGAESSAVAGDEFFDDARDLVSAGDIVMVSGESGGSIVFVKPLPEATT